MRGILVEEAWWCLVNFCTIVSFFRPLYSLPAMTVPYTIFVFLRTIYSTIVPFQQNAAYYCELLIYRLAYARHHFPEWTRKKCFLNAASCCWVYQFFFLSRNAWIPNEQRASGKPISCDEPFSHIIMPFIINFCVLYSILFLSPSSLFAFNLLFANYNNSSMHPRASWRLSISIGNESSCLLVIHGAPYAPSYPRREDPWRRNQHLPINTHEFVSIPNNLFAMIAKNSTRNIRVRCRCELKWESSLFSFINIFVVQAKASRKKQKKQQRIETKGEGQRRTEM